MQRPLLKRVGSTEANRSQMMWSKVAAVVATVTVLGLAAPASAQMYGGWSGVPTLPMGMAEATEEAGGAAHIATITITSRAAISHMCRGIAIGAGGAVTECQ